MIKQLLNSVIAKYRDLPVSRTSIICLRLRQIIDLLATNKSRYFAQPRPIIVNYLPSAVYIALMLEGPNKWLKQINQIKLNRVKNLKWSEANQLANYKRDRRFELGTTLYRQPRFWPEGRPAVLWTPIFGRNRRKIHLISHTFTGKREFWTASFQCLAKSLPTTNPANSQDGIGASELQIQRCNRSPTLPRFNESIF